MNLPRGDSLDALAKFGFAATLVALLTCAPSLAQSATRVTRPQTFHIQGKVLTSDGPPLPGAQVMFRHGESIKTVLANSKGIYRAALPVGLYTMDVGELGISAFQEYERPLFRVTSPISLTLDVTLDREGPTCDYGMPPQDRLPAHDDDDPICGGGRDLFLLPSKDNVPFGLLIRYRTRRSSQRAYIYNAGRDWPDWTTPVFAAYNLFTLRADHVVYDTQTETLRATGNVVAANPGGVTRHAESLTFRIENGQANPLPK